MTPRVGQNRNFVLQAAVHRYVQCSRPCSDSSGCVFLGCLRFRGCSFRLAFGVGSRNLTCRLCVSCFASHPPLLNPEFSVNVGSSSGWLGWSVGSRRSFPSGKISALGRDGSATFFRGAALVVSFILCTRGACESNLCVVRNEKQTNVGTGLFFMCCLGARSTCQSTKWTSALMPPVAARNLRRDLTASFLSSRTHTGPHHCHQA